jgi:hypothetical protein
MSLADVATHFATVVGLLADFSSLRLAKSDKDYSDFLSWLSENRHEDIVRLLELNGATATSIKALLHQDRALLIQKLDQLDKSLATIASSIDGLQPLAEAVRPGARLSPQALRILREFDASGAGKALETRTLSGRSLMLFEGADGLIKFDDPRFADDDLNTLVEIGLLRLDYNSNGKKVYIFTRLAADVLKTLAGDA